MPCVSKGNIPCVFNGDFRIYVSHVLYYTALSVREQGNIGAGFGKGESLKKSAVKGLFGG
jgi:hypothetical protein